MHFRMRHHGYDQHGRHAVHDGFGRGRHGEGGHGRRGGPGRESRLFEHGDLRLVIVALLAEKPRYGYDIIKALEERVGGGYSPSPGVVYPTLTMLEELGHAVISEERAGRKLYTLSPEGLAFHEAEPERRERRARPDRCRCGGPGVDRPPRSSGRWKTCKPPCGCA